MIIALDGPAASGKGTLARRLAAYYSLNHLDTGLTYRAVAAALLARGLPLGDEEIAISVARNLDFTNLDRNLLSAHEVGEAASRIAVLSGLRTELVRLQREFGEQGDGAVLDGRDIGTVVCPNATAKLYITASAEVRARRRTDELRGKGIEVDFFEILKDLQRRDERDMSRADSPLRPAEDAHLLDTTEMDIDSAFNAAVEIIERSRKN
ncbi:(d)CMP kinase [Rhodobacteraceae bacterium RKSG542]|uniref:(d)CMP kinase n=1 Tax=Pseudovibrio flavus TaxID=2529854 RepID=UPI0012BB5B5C|nr:(d)CMP kinase [Pseudovibrio flavus]MTI17792.1 (d)CMP kinase [Pseudovibrio flavus]